MKGRVKLISPCLSLIPIDCNANPTDGPESRVQQITVELGQTTATPTASFTAAPNPAEVNQIIVFDASGSKDNDTEGADPAIIKYFWSFGTAAHNL